MVRQVLRKELGLKIVEVETERASIEGGDVLWTGELNVIMLKSKFEHENGHVGH